MVSQLIPHALKWDHVGRCARISSAAHCRTVQDTLQSAGCYTLGYMQLLFQKSPIPALLHHFHPTQTARLLQAEPVAFCSALPCPTLPHHNPVSFHLTILARA